MAVDAFSPSDTPDIQLQLGNLLYADGRFSEALTAFQHAVGSSESRACACRPASGWCSRRCASASFQTAQSRGARCCARSGPRTPSPLAVYGDAMWSAGPVRRSRAGPTRRRWRSSRTRRGPQRHRAGRCRPGAATTRRWSTALHGGPARAARGRLPPHARQRLRAAGPVRPWRPRRSASFINLLPKGLADSRARVGGGRAQVPDVVRQAKRRTRSRPTRTRSTRCRSGSRTRRSSSRAASTAAGRSTSSSTRARSCRRSRGTTGRTAGVTPITYTVSAGVGRGRAARAAARADRQAGVRRAEGEARAVHHQEPGAAGPADARGRELLAARAGPVDARSTTPAAC